MATHAGMSANEFDTIARDWIKSTKHPKSGKPYTEMTYQPMLELLAYLRQNGFKTYIVSGGGIEFMRPWTEKVYGIPPEQVVGSSIKLKYEVKDGKPALMRLPQIDLIDDKEGKPVGIQSHIGRRPIAAFGNSDGDFQMIEWVTAGDGPRFGMIMHHDDAEREVAFRQTRQSFGRRTETRMAHHEHERRLEMRFRRSVQIAPNVRDAVSRRAAVVREQIVGSLGMTLAIAVLAATLPVGLAIIYCGILVP